MMMTMTKSKSYITYVSSTDLLVDDYDQIKLSMSESEWYIRYEAEKPCAHTMMTDGQTDKPACRGARTHLRCFKDKQGRG